MALYFKTDDFEVGTKFWSQKTYVKNRITGEVVYPPGNLIDKLFNITLASRDVAMTNDERRHVGDYLVARFCAAAFDRNGLHSMMFLDAQPQKFIDAALQAMRQPEMMADLGFDEPILEYEDRDFALLMSRHGHRRSVRGKNSGRVIQARLRDEAQLLEVLDAAEVMGIFARNGNARGKIYRAFCIAVTHGEQHAVGAMFLGQAPEVVALGFGTMPD